MTPVEQLRASIADLEQQRYRSKPGRWTISNGAVMHSGGIGLNPVLLRQPTSQADAELIVTLHRTIDAQLAILRHALARAEAKIAGGGIAHAVWSHERDALTLADAILNRTPVDALVDEYPGLGHHVDRDKLRDHVATLFDVDAELLTPPALAEEDTHE